LENIGISHIWHNGKVIQKPKEYTTEKNYSREVYFIGSQLFRILTAELNYKN
jgi:hypothetical protein